MKKNKKNRRKKNKKKKETYTDTHQQNTHVRRKAPSREVTRSGASKKWGWDGAYKAKEGERERK